MRLVFAVAGEGYGHATRSRPVIERLRKRHDVRIFAGGKALPYLRRFFPVSWIASTRLVYGDNSIRQLRTVLLNLVRAPLYAMSFLVMLGVMLFRRPDALITDFEPWSAYAALLTGVRVVSIDNENVITNACISLPKEHWWSFARAWIVTKLIIPFAHAVIIPSYFHPPLKNSRARYCAPIIRKEIASLKATSGRHVLVYQTSSTNEQLLAALRRLPRQEFIVYGFPRGGREANVVFKRFSEQEFFQDLASAKAVIANGGFSLLTEALFLRKPILSIPIRGQCEQIINAHYLQRLGYGMMAHEATPRVIARFLSRLGQQREALKALLRWKTQAALQEIEGVVQNATA